MTKLNKILTTYEDETFIKADGYDDAIIGVDEKSMRLIYSVQKIINKLKKEMSHDEALEYFEFNIAGAYVGEKTPIYCYD